MTNNAPEHSKVDANLRAVQRWSVPVFEHTADVLRGDVQIESFRDQYISPGIHSFYSNGIPIDCLVRPTEYKPLVVFLTPLTNRSSEVKAPVFVGQRVCPDDGLSSLLSISDPALLLDPNLRVGWFQGLPSVGVPTLVHAIIEFYRRALGAPYIILCGGSSAGFASIKLLPKLNQCIAIVWNPQIDIRRFFQNDVCRYARLFEECDETNAATVLERHVSTSALDSLTLSSNQALFALQNESDTHHLRYHWPLLLQHLRGGHEQNSSRISLNIFAAVYDWGTGHEPLPRAYLRRVLQAAVSDESMHGGFLGLQSTISQSLEEIFSV